MTKHTGSFQIPFLGSCPLSIGWKISLISLARYVISGHSDRSPILLSDNCFIRIRFQINHSSEKYANFIQRTERYHLMIYKVQVYGQRVEKYCIIVQKLRQIMHLFRHHPNCTLYWSDSRCVREGSARPRLRWHWRSYSCVAAWFWWQCFCK